MKAAPRFVDGTFRNTQEVAPGLKKGTAAVPAGVRTEASSRGRPGTTPGTTPWPRCDAYLLNSVVTTWSCKASTIVNT
jgi:hypothetical protein